MESVKEESVDNMSSNETPQEQQQTSLASDDLTIQNSVPEIDW